VPVDVVRWAQVEVPADGERDLAGLLAGCEQRALAACEGDAEAWAVRLVLTGRSPLHRELQGTQALAAFEEELRALLAGAARPVLLESGAGQHPGDAGSGRAPGPGRPPPRRCWRAGEGARRPSPG